MTVTKAIRVLTRRRDYLVARRAGSFDGAEAAALKQAIRALEVIRSYGFVVLCDHGPLLHRQLPLHDGDIPPDVPTP